MPQLVLATPCCNYSFREREGEGDRQLAIFSRVYSSENKKKVYECAYEKWNIVKSNS